MRASDACERHEDEDERGRVARQGHNGQGHNRNQNEEATKQNKPSKQARQNTPKVCVVVCLAFIPFFRLCGLAVFLVHFLFFSRVFLLLGAAAVVLMRKAKKKLYCNMARLAPSIRPPPCAASLVDSIRRVSSTTRGRKLPGAWRSRRAPTTLPDTLRPPTKPTKHIPLCTHRHLVVALRTNYSMFATRRLTHARVARARAHAHAHRAGGMDGSISVRPSVRPSVRRPSVRPHRDPLAILPYYYTIHGTAPPSSLPHPHITRRPPARPPAPPRPRPRSPPCPPPPPPRPAPTAAPRVGP